MSDKSSDWQQHKRDDLRKKGKDLSDIPDYVIISQ